MNSKEMVKLAYQALSDKKERTLKSLTSSLYQFWQIIL